MIVHLIDGTYELFRHFYGLRRFTKGKDRPYGAVVGVLNGLLQLVESGATHVGVATDHVIESFRNRLWADYKTSAGIEPALLAPFHPLEEALAAMADSLHSHNSKYGGCTQVAQQSRGEDADAETA